MGEKELTASAATVDYNVKLYQNNKVSCRCGGRKGKKLNFATAFRNYWNFVTACNESVNNAWRGECYNGPPTPTKSSYLLTEAIVDNMETMMKSCAYGISLSSMSIGRKQAMNIGKQDARPGSSRHNITTGRQKSLRSDSSANP
ncbi:MAG: hypothetical protein ACLTZH_02380 [Subdoligranulum sp.]